MEKTQSILVLSAHGIIIIDYLISLLKITIKIIFKQLQLILTQLIGMHATSDRPTLGFTQVTQPILKQILCAINCSAAKFNIDNKP